MKKIIIIMTFIILFLPFTYAVTCSTNRSLYIFYDDMEDATTGYNSSFWSKTGNVDRNTTIVYSGSSSIKAHAIGNLFKTAYTGFSGLDNFTIDVWVQIPSAHASARHYPLWIDSGSDWSYLGYRDSIAAGNWFVYDGGNQDTGNDVPFGEWVNMKLFHNSTHEIFFEGDNSIYNSTTPIPVTSVMWKAVLAEDAASVLFIDELKAYVGAQCPLASDTEAPGYTNFQNDGDNVSEGDTVTFNVTLTDETSLHSYIFSNNLSGTFTNNTPVLIDGNPSWNASETIVVTTHNKTICARYFFNDTSANNNQTNLSCFFVNPTISNIKLAIRNLETGRNVINFYDNGDAEFNGTIYYDSAVERTLPFLTSPRIAYRQLLNMKFRTKEQVHETAVTECKAEGGTRTECLIKAIISSFQLIDKRLNRLEKIFTWKSEYKKKLQDLELKHDRLLLKFKALKKEVNRIRKAANITKVNSTRV